MTNDKKSLVSVIVPIYKVEDYLDECVKSIVGQTYKNIEIILVDDGSPDSCPQKCDEWAKKDQRIRVVHKANGGLSSARNAGLDVAKGEYISFVDSDDFITPDYVEVMYHRICKDNSVGIVSGMVYQYINGEISHFNEAWFLEKEKITSFENFSISCIYQTVSHSVWNKLFRKSLITGVRFREGKTNEDTLFMYDLGKVIKKTHYSMVEIPHYVYYYRYREDSICTSNKKPLFIDVIQNLKDMMKDCEDKLLLDAMYFRLTKSLYSFLDSILWKDLQKKMYFKQYQKEIRQIPFSYVLSNYKAKDVFYIQVLKWCPEIRKIIQLFTKKIFKRY